MARIVVTGATGFVGKRLSSDLLARGHEVVALTRDPSRAAKQLPQGVRAERWDPSSTAAAAPAIDGAYGVVHLAGEQAVGKRWNAEVKREIMESRVKGAEAITLAIERAAKKPSVFVTSSGVGYYGAHGDEPLDESAPAGSDFLARVTIAWEGAALGAEKFGVRVVRNRLGIVFGRGGGALVDMVKPFKLFAGGPIGSGKQIVSWIHLDDASAVFCRAIDDDNLSGAVNVTAPDAVSNEELARHIGAVLHRPSVIPVPEFALRIRFGEGADPIVTGQRAVPSALLARGFTWKFPDVKGALEEALK
jgi:uncharacterized protein (TIGR01777 family)